MNLSRSVCNQGGQEAEASPEEDSLGRGFEPLGSSKATSIIVKSSSLPQRIVCSEADGVLGSEDRTDQQSWLQTFPELTDDICSNDARQCGRNQLL